MKSLRKVPSKLTLLQVIEKGANIYDNMWQHGIDHVQFRNILLERQFDRKKDPENFREILLSTDRFIWKMRLIYTFEDIYICTYVEGSNKQASNKAEQELQGYAEFSYYVI